MGETKYKIVKTHDWYDPEGLGIKDKGDVVFEGNKEETSARFSEIKTEMNAMSKASIRNGHRTIDVTERGSDSLEVYYFDAISKVFYTLLPCDSPREKKMRTFSIPVTWDVYGTVEVEAESAEEALKEFRKIEDSCGLPTEMFYVEDSFRVSDDDEKELLETIEIISKSQGGLNK